MPFNLKTDTKHDFQVHIGYTLRLVLLVGTNFSIFCGFMKLAGINFSDFELVLSLIHTCLVCGPRYSQSWTFGKMTNSILIRCRLKMLTQLD